MLLLLPHFISKCHNCVPTTLSKPIKAIADIAFCIDLHLINKFYQPPTFEAHIGGIAEAVNDLCIINGAELK